MATVTNWVVLSFCALWQIPYSDDVTLLRDEIVGIVVPKVAASEVEAAKAVLRPKLSNPQSVW